MIQDWIDEYAPQNEEETTAALREIMQEITLGALARTDFFENAAFYGGTALRILYGLDRFSEDLDFSLLHPNETFSLEPYFPSIIEEFATHGITVTLREKDKKTTTAIESAFLKTETIWKELILEDVVKQLGIRSNRNVKIKIEIDRHPPQHFETEEKLLLRPHSFYVKCFTRPCLFAGKLHALLFRQWKNRVKGRDWYDLEWYIRKGIPLDVQHFLQRAKESDDWNKESGSPQEILDLLKKKIHAVSFDQVKQDIAPFIKDKEQLHIWSARYFEDVVEKIKFVE